MRRDESSLLEPVTDEQRARQDQVRSYGAHDDFAEMDFKNRMIEFALESVEEIVGLPFETQPEPVEGEDPIEPATAWDIVDSVACEAAGIDDETEMTPELLDDYNVALSQLAHAYGHLSGSEQVAGMAFESVQDQDSEGIAKVCGSINDQLLHHGRDDDELAIEYVMEASIVHGETDDDDEVAVEKVQTVFRAGKKTRVEKRKKKIRGSALAALKRSGRMAGRKPKSSATKRLIGKSLRKRHKAGK